MAKFLRYKGEFLSRAGIVWRVEILQDADVPFEKIGSLIFEADDPLVIEWSHTGKEEVIGGSTATLRIESPGDRTYEDLYTIAPGRIRMDVYRNNQLYWSGALDPEFYEEPYERAANYTVSLMFSDFGMLDRLKYDLSGMRTLYDIVEYCVGRMAINTILDESLISTSLSPDGMPMGLADLKVRSDNFYDEDGEALTLKEVLEGVLQPLALRMVQRAGRVYIYDLNALYTEAQTNAVVWDGDSQTMSTDRVYNNAKITWSPYVQSDELLPDECYTEKVNDTEIAINTKYGQTPFGGWLGDDVIFTFPCTSDLPINVFDLGFTLWLTNRGKNLEIIDKRAKFYSIVPHLDGQASEGIALCWTGIQNKRGEEGAKLDYLTHGIPKDELCLKNYPPKADKAIFRSNVVEIPKINNARYGLRISLEMLMDGRFNPFESVFVNWEEENKAAGQNHEWFTSWWDTYGNMVYVPVTIQYRENGTGKLWVWSNREYVTAKAGQFLRPVEVPYLQETYGKWVENTGDIETPSDMGYIAYYQNDNRNSGAGAGTRGWTTNRPAIPSTSGKLGITVIKAQDGQYIPYPDFGKDGGQLWMEVRSGGWNIVNIPLVNYSGSAFIQSIGDPYNFFKYNKFNWLLFKLPQIEILNFGLLDTPIDSDDIEYRAEINADAKDDIVIDTICGSRAGGVPLARGAYFSTDTGDQITALTRAGRTSQIEDLLIGTLFSQFGQRRTKLSGEMKITITELSAYTEANQEGKKFMITEDTQNAIADTSDATITELRPDEYERRV